jgi:hypothetical protein
LGFAFGVHFSQVERQPVRVAEIFNRIANQMTDTELVLNHAESAIEALESQLGILAEIAADAGTAQKTVETVALEIKNLHDNPNNLDLKARSNRLRDLSATEQLHRSDAKHLQAAVETQKRRVIEAGGIARQVVQGIWSIAHLQRRSNAVEMIRNTFDLKKCPVPVEGLAQAEKGYLQSRDLEYFFATPSRSTDDRVAALRELPGRFAIVRKIAQETPGLDLSSILPEPAATESQLVEA